MTWFLRMSYIGVGLAASTLLAHAEPEYAAHPAWHIPLGLVAVGWMVLIAIVGEDAARCR